MLGESLRAPFRADDWIGTILVGSVLTLLVGVVGVLWVLLLIVSPPVGGAVVPLVALPSLVLRGYLVGAVRSGIRQEPTVDSFVDWGLLVRDGTRSTLISAIYLIPAAALCGLALGGGIATVVDPDGFDGAIQAIAAVVILIGGFGLLIYGLVYLYIRPAARAVFAATGSVQTALDVRRVVRLSVTAEYISGWLIGMGILVVGPTLLVPLFPISLAFGVISPGVALVGVLSTLLFGIITLFVCRVSAAYATGRGSAAGVAALLTAVERLDEPTALNAASSSSPPPPRPPEASVAVQTGRTVHSGEQSSAPVAADESDADSLFSSTMLPVRLHDEDLSGAPVYPRLPTGGPMSATNNEPDSAENEPDSADGKPASADNKPDSADDNSASTDGEPDTTDGESETDSDRSVDDDTEFVWGPTDE